MTPTMHPNSMPDARADETTLAGLMPEGRRILAVVGAGALAFGFALGALYGDGHRYFFHAYLTSFSFLLSITLGSLVLVTALHATRAGWGVSVRRIAEILAANLPIAALMFLPIVVLLAWGHGGLYPWNSPEYVAAEPLLEAKAGYLSFLPFLARAVGYFAVWWIVGRFYLRHSLDQDASGEAALTVRMERWSGPALVALGVTGTWAAFDWLMSLTPLWHSTIFGLYWLSGGVVGALAAWILLAMGLQRVGRLRSAITVEHYHDLGKLLFAAVVFWGYMAFSQYLLIWYANIPEETVWYRPRLAGPWGWVALAVLLGHLLVPFFGLLSRHAKRSRRALAFWAVWLLAFHWLDLAWIVMPSARGRGFPVGLVDLCVLVGLGCFYVAAAWGIAQGLSLVPAKDPRLPEAMGFENM
jgi:hypothetical protein